MQNLHLMIKTLSHSVQSEWIEIVMLYSTAQYNKKSHSVQSEWIEMTQFERCRQTKLLSHSVQSEWIEINVFDNDLNTFDRLTLFRVSGLKLFRNGAHG